MALFKQRPPTLDAWQWISGDDPTTRPQWIIDAFNLFPAPGGLAIVGSLKGGALLALVLSSESTTGPVLATVPSTGWVINRNSSLDLALDAQFVASFEPADGTPLPAALPKV